MAETTLYYLENPYLTELSASIVEVDTQNSQAILYIDTTIFYPQGGGQPADNGTITGKNGKMTVTHVSFNNGYIQHKGILTGELTVGEEVTLQIDWNRRYLHMQLHTAGHILDQAVKNCLPGVFGVDGDHGIGKRNFVAFNKKIEVSDVEKIQQSVNELIAESLPITFEMVTSEEIKKRNIPLPFELPQNKKLRLTQIGSYAPMPDGGTHLKNTSESWKITIDEIQEKNGLWRVCYSVESKNTNKTTIESKPIITVSEQPSQTLPIANTMNESSLSTIREQIHLIESQLVTDLESAHSTEQIETTYLGKKGLFNQLAKQLTQINSDQRREAGALLNECKTKLTQLIEAKKQSNVSANTTQAWQDLTIPGTKPTIGGLHPVSQAINEITHIFEKIGFTRVRYPEVDWDWYAFESLNMSPDHPARDEWETFFVDLPDSTKDIAYDAQNPRKRHPEVAGGKIVLTPHTSNGQVREMERLGKPPIRMINIGRCYRRQQDVTHTQMFHQFEGLVVDKNITIQHLKGTLDHFAREFYGEGTKSRIRPFHFQFTEPSFEVDFSCHICHGTGEIQDPQEKNGEKTKCRFCKSGWHEVGGAGMVHPNVLKAGGIDPEEYTGFAFGWGIERTYTLREGLNLDDIRLLYSGDMRFLQQF